MYRDLNSNLDAQESLRPAVLTADADGESVDLLGADSATIVVSVGAITGSVNGTTALTLEESDDNSSWADVADADILGAEPIGTDIAANTAYQFGYIGAARYIRATWTKGGETNAAVAAMVVRGHLHKAPSAQAGTAPTYAGT
jgi:YD repeat-containing protein